MHVIVNRQISCSNRTCTESVMWNIQCFYAHDLLPSHTRNIFINASAAWFDENSSGDGCHICAITRVNVIPGVIRQHEYICMDSARW